MTEQELMFDDPADRKEYYERWVEEHCRPTHPSTSMEAAEKIAPKINEKESRALVVLRNHGEGTASELEHAAALSAFPAWQQEGQIRKRLSDLRAKGLAEVVGKRKCRITNMTAQVWRAVDSAD